MEFVRVKEDLIRLDTIERIREGRSDETYYGRSVRKGTESWIEIHFLSGEVLKLEGEAAELLRNYLEHECVVRDLSVPPPVNPAAPTVPNGVWNPPQGAAR